MNADLHGLEKVLYFFICGICVHLWLNSFHPIDLDLAIRSIGFILIVSLTARERMKKMQVHIILSSFEFAQWPQ